MYLDSFARCQHF